MLGSLVDLINGWRQVRCFQGFSYEVSRNGKRRVVPIDGYLKRGTPDMRWVKTGRFAEEKLFEMFRNFSYAPSLKETRQRLAKRDFALAS
jgi:hypothetical protein